MVTSVSDKAAAIGLIAAAPTSGTVILRAADVEYPFFKLRFELNAARLPVTDATTSGSFGALKLFDFREQSIRPIGSRANFTAFAEGAALTTAAGDAAFKIGVGTAAVAAAADNALSTTSVDIVPAVSVTLSGGTGTGTATTALSNAFDGTSTPIDLYLNFSGSAATIDASSYIDVTGTITVFGVMLDDD